VRNPAELAWLGDAREHARAVLALYGAGVDGATEFNRGRKDGRSVVVVPPATPATASLVKKLAGEAKPAGKVDILAGDWALGFDENPSTFTQQGLDVRLVQIPSTSDILALLVGTGMGIEDLSQHEVPAAIQAAAQFYTLPDVIISHKMQKGELTLMLEGYRYDDRGHGDARAKPGEDPLGTVDYIGIDWDHDGRVFSIGSTFVQARKNPVATCEFSHQYHAQGPHDVVVRIIDAFGHDSTRLGQFDVVL
jgi:hypothetical protein